MPALLPVLPQLPVVSASAAVPQTLPRRLAQQAPGSSELPRRPRPGPDPDPERHAMMQVSGLRLRSTQAVVPRLQPAPRHCLTAAEHQCPSSSRYRATSRRQATLPAETSSECPFPATMSVCDSLLPSTAPFAACEFDYLSARYYKAEGPRCTKAILRGHHKQLYGRHKHV